MCMCKYIDINIYPLLVAKTKHYQQFSLEDNLPGIYHIQYNLFKVKCFLRNISTRGKLSILDNTVRILLVSLTFQNIFLSFIFKQIK